MQLELRNCSIVDNVDLMIGAPKERGEPQHARAGGTWHARATQTPTRIAWP